MMNVFFDNDTEEALDQEEDEELDQNILDKINISNSTSDTEGSFSGDIKQFYNFLEERLGAKKLNLIRDIVIK